MPPPTDGIASAASALRYWERRQEVAAHNLANANTDGFKAQRTFAQLVGTSELAIGARTDWTEGTFTPTKNPLDVAVRGSAFLVVDTPNGERYSRGGSWQVDREGFLADLNGHRVLGEQGPIRVSGNQVVIDRSGRVAVDDVWVDRLRVESLPPNTTLQHEDGVLWVPPTDRTVQEAGQRDVLQGTLEESNVQPVSEMVDMIAVQRNYAFVQKAITTLDDIRATIAHDLAKPLG
jgi:flagellar basal-body rod protein FlgF